MILLKAAIETLPQGELDQPLLPPRSNKRDKSTKIQPESSSLLQKYFVPTVAGLSIVGNGLGMYSSSNKDKIHKEKLEEASKKLKNSSRKAYATKEKLNKMEQELSEQKNEINQQKIKLDAQAAQAAEVEKKQQELNKKELEINTEKKELDKIITKMKEKLKNFAEGGGKFMDIDDITYYIKEKCGEYRPLEELIKDIQNYSSIIKHNINLSSNFDIIIKFINDAEKYKIMHGEYNRIYILVCKNIIEDMKEYLKKIKEVLQKNCGQISELNITPITEVNAETIKAALKNISDEANKLECKNKNKDKLEKLKKELTQIKTKEIETNDKLLTLSEAMFVMHEYINLFKEEKWFITLTNNQFKNIKIKNIKAIVATKAQAINVDYRDKLAPLILQVVTKDQITQYSSQEIKYNVQQIIYQQQINATHKTNLQQGMNLIINNLYQNINTITEENIRFQIYQLITNIDVNNSELQIEVCKQYLITNNITPTIASQILSQVYQALKIN